MHRVSARRISRLLLVLLVLLALLSLCACQPFRFANRIPQITIEVSESRITVPAEAPSGIVTVIFKNTGSTLQSPGLLRLREGLSQQEFNHEFDNGPEATLPFISLLGGQNIPSGGSLRITWDLIAGTYVAVNFSSDQAVMADFEVTQEQRSPARTPRAKIRIDMKDFYFGMPVTVHPGVQTWEIVNTGEQWHEMGIVKLNTGYTGFDLLLALGSHQTSAGAPIFEEVFFWAPMSQGERAWVTVDLPLGTYFVVCNLPDFKDGARHYQKGMISRLEVK